MTAVLVFFAISCPKAQKPAMDTVRYADGGIKEVFAAVDGVRCGGYKYFYPNGLIGQEAVYVDGVLDGPFAMYYPEGGIKMTCSFCHGHRHGLMSLYDESGILLETLTFDMDNIRGENVRYYNTGERDIVATRIGDLWQGEVRSFYKSGRLKSLTEYRDGMKHGLMKTYFDNDSSSLMNVSHYERDIRTGEYVAYYSNGCLAEKGAFLGGERSGMWVSFYPDGATVYTTGRYEDGNYHGLWRIYHPDGSIKQTALFQQGYEHGAVDYAKGKKLLYFMGSPL